MSLTDDEALKFLSGTPVLFEDVCAIYPATLREIAEVGYENFEKFLGILTVTKPTDIKKEDKELNELFSKLTGFQYLLSLTFFDPNAMLLVRRAFKFFIHEDVTFFMEPVEIVVGNPDDKHIINENNFYDFQRILKHMYFLDIEGEEIIINDNDSPTLKRMKRQMIANREKVKRAKAKKNAQEKNDLKFSDLIASLPLNNCGLNLINIWDMTYYAFHDQLKRMGWRDQFNLNHQAALAGAKIKEKDLKHWIRSISNAD